MTGGAVLNRKLFYYESAFSALPPAASSHWSVKGTGLNRLALDLRLVGVFVAVVPSQVHVKKIMVKKQ